MSRKIKPKNKSLNSQKNIQKGGKDNFNENNKNTKTIIEPKKEKDNYNSEGFPQNLENKKETFEIISNSSLDSKKSRIISSDNSKKSGNNSSSGTHNGKGSSIPYEESYSKDDTVKIKNTEKKIIKKK